MRIVLKDERKSGHVMDGNRFYEKFEDRVVECADCGYPLHYRDLFTTTDQSLGEHDKEED